MHEARVSIIPDCQWPTCDQLAAYDARVYFGPSWRQWGYVCEAHFVEGQGSTGMGKGQKLVLVKP